MLNSRRAGRGLVLPAASRFGGRGQKLRQLAELTARSGSSPPPSRPLIFPDIARAAERTVKENEKIGPRFAQWARLPEDLHPDTVSRDPVFAPAAISPEGVA
jgi:hypothetical protein